MALYYSPSANAFFDDAICAPPDDACAITVDRHRELLAGQAGGAAIVAGRDGNPRLQRHRASTQAQRAQLMQQVKREAGRRILAVSPLWRQLNDIRHPDLPDSMARFAAIDAVRAASQAIETAIDQCAPAKLAAINVPSHPLWPEG